MPRIDTEELGFACLRQEVQDLCKNKKYSQALLLLDRQERGYSHSNGDRAFQVLEWRCQVLLMSNDLSGARPVAKAMIKKDRTNGRGYRYCSRIERLEGDYDAALKWCSHGLKNVSESDSFYAKLVVEKTTVDEAALKHRVLSRPRDPFTVLPHEILQMIVSYLQYRTAVGIIRVSRQWRRTLEVMQPIANTIDFLHPLKTVTRPMLQPCLRRCKAPTRISFDHQHLSQAARSDLGAYLKSPTVKNLTEFRANYVEFYYLRHLSNLHTLHLRQCLNSEEVSTLLRDLQSLQDVSFREIVCGNEKTISSIGNWRRSGLRRLELGGGDEIMNEIETSFLLRFPCLEVLQLHQFKIVNSSKPQIGNGDLESWPSGQVVDLSGLRKLKMFHMAKCESTSWPILPTSIRILDLRGFMPGATRATQLLNLEVAHFSQCPTAYAVDILRGILPSLKFLTIGENRGSEMHFTPYRELFSDGHLQSVEQLVITSPRLHDDDVAVIANHCPRLEALTIECGILTGVSVRKLLEARVNGMKRLVLRMCMEISPDAVEWARAQGVDVLFERDGKEKRVPGRKVREEHLGGRR